MIINNLSRKLQRLKSAYDAIKHVNTPRLNAQSLPICLIFDFEFTNY
jgi:hypothetical protein